MLSILQGAITIGMIAGMPFSEIVSAVNDGISNPYIIIGLGVKGYFIQKGQLYKRQGGSRYAEK